MHNVFERTSNVSQTFELLIILVNKTVLYNCFRFVLKMDITVLQHQLDTSIGHLLS